MSVIDEFREFSRQLWMEANQERKSYCQDDISFSDYLAEYEEFLLDEFHRHKFEL